VLHVAELLLNWKANVKACDLQSNTALHHACQRKHNRSALLLLGRTDDVEFVNMTNKDLRTYVYKIVPSGYLTCFHHSLV
jgi:ankyrin repeat protein